MQTEEEKLENLANYNYQMTEEDEANFLSNYQNDLVKIKKLFPKLSRLETIALLLYTFECDANIATNFVNIDGSNVLIYLELNGKTVVRANPQAELQAYKDSSFKNAREYYLYSNISMNTLSYLTH